MNVLETTARAGYAARGVVYLVVGGFALQAALAGGEMKNTDDAAPVLLAQPFGQVLVGLLALGLLSYAVWRGIQGVFDMDDHGRGPKGLVVRGSMLAAGVVYAGLALSAAALVTSIARNSGGEGGGAEMLMAEAIALVGATWTAAILAAVFLGAAIAHAVRAYRASFMRFFAADPTKRRIVEPIGRIGIVARGVVFLILSGLMALRAWTARGSSEPPPNLVEVLAVVRGLPAGGWILAAMGIGLMAFGVYSLAAAAYRTIDCRPLVRGGYGDLVSSELSPLSVDVTRRRA
ncbi:MAG TPA: DUF1206 domain-containing protein [Methylomirabilota bacterium]|nr:DUF1206 domain-containing protein [Methylomirabilota bacterium]